MQTELEEAKYEFTKLSGLHDKLKAERSQFTKAITASNDQVDKLTKARASWEAELEELKARMENAGIEL